MLRKATSWPVDERRADLMGFPSTIGEQAMAKRLSKCERLERTAYHEAGHAVAENHYAGKIKTVSIIPKDDTLGRMRAKNPFAGKPLDTVRITPHLEKKIRDQIVVSLAGGVAEFLFAGRKCHVGASGDYHNAVDLAERLHGFNTAVTEKYLDYLYAVAKNLMESRWKAVQALATALMEENEIDGARALDIIRDAIYGPDVNKRLKENAASLASIGRTANKIAVDG